ncbi:MAG: NAD-glutamate dehydrogenase [Pseudorhodoplanes sp.]
MAADNFIGTDEERAALDFIDDAASALHAQQPDIPKTFVSHLFGRVAPEDLVGYEPEELAALAAQAWDMLAVRKPGAPKIRFATAPEATKGARLKGVSIIEIVNDDMPFLVDSVMAELAERKVQLRLVAHPVLNVVRDQAGRLVQYREDRADGALRESFIHIEIERIDDEVVRTGIVQALEQVLADVRVSVADWRPMMERVEKVIADLRANPPPLPVDETAEAIQFLEWLVANNFTFLGVRDYVLNADKKLEPKWDSGLGVLRRQDVAELQGGAGRETMAQERDAVFDEPKALTISKASIRSRVHRHIFMDYVGVKRFGAFGQPPGEFRIVGLLTSTAYTRPTRSIPYLRRKVDAIVARARFDPNSHSGKALINILDNYPRDELFQIDEETLFRFALAILQLDERPRVRVLPRRDRLGRFVSVLVYIPRDRAGSEVVRSVGEFLAEIYRGETVNTNVFFPEGPLVRTHFIIARLREDSPDPDRATLEYAVNALVRTWTDALSETLVLAHEPGIAQRLFARYRDAFSGGYRTRYSPAIALEDIRVMETLSAERPLGVDFYSREDEGAAAIGLKIWSLSRPIALSERVPILENMGFRVVDERTSEILPADGESHIWLHDMALERADGQPVGFEVLKGPLETMFLMVMRGLAENDGYNALVLAAGLSWRQIVLLRALSRYLRQIRVPFSQSYMWETLRKHSAVAAKIVSLFETRFDPGSGTGKEARERQEATIAEEIEAALAGVQSLDEDRILRHFVNVVRVALRTNFYQTDHDGGSKFLIAIKFDSRRVDDLPLPRPLYEIFVYSPRVEGVHLRFGKVARGGIRWSDRPQDFRTEILGLVKAQQVKNAVIVPVGAKGGFVPKLMPSGPREAVQAEGVATYKLFIASLLDITDNLDSAGVIAPPDVVRHDADDPYLVVAADKGTATFSDTANAISIAHRFWLGDAFASGGSVGYDHKAMGITARGAWESVKRHFREMDIDIATTPFTVAGVGDMSGDVFGNGMLRESTIKLVLAFDHRDIFVDPAPDPEKSFIERERLFRLPRSSWQDYDKTLISKGGGVFSRSAKEIPLSPEMQALLALSGRTATPQQVMKAILKAKVDLLFFGGIGTYVRAAAESDDAVGDRANDAIRVTGAELNCRVIGEGANLGMTQRGRIEAALNGVRLNTDAIDNSAGVNTSDVEVNIKIALSAPVQDGALSEENRNALLATMTGEVAELVLRNNYLQTLALSLAARKGLDDLGFLQRLMQMLEKSGALDRAVEFLPDDMTIAERRKRSQALTRPELAVLLAYAKLSLYEELLKSKVPDDPYLGRELERYFPPVLVERFPDAVVRHRLRREIIATQLTNSMINRGGPSLIPRMADEAGAAPETVAMAFAAVRDSYDMPGLNGDINALDAKVPGAVQLELYAALQNLLLDRLIWFVRNVDLSKGLDSVVSHYRDGIAAVEAALDQALSPDAVAARDARADALQGAGVPQALARRIANLPALTAAPDIVLVSERTGKKVSEIAATFFAASDFFQVDSIVASAREIVVTDYFDRLALDRALDSLGEAIRRITAEMTQGGKLGQEAVDAWVQPRAAEIERIRLQISEIAGAGLTVSKLMVAANLLGDLARA